MLQYSRPRDPGEQLDDRPHVNLSFGPFDNQDAYVVGAHTGCVSCGYPFYCPCSNCFRHIPAGMFPYRHSVNGLGIEMLECGNCGHAESIDERTERQMLAYEELQP